jgi:hypothetical protein
LHRNDIGNVDSEVAVATGQVAVVLAENEGAVAETAAAQHEDFGVIGAAAQPDPLLVAENACAEQAIRAPCLI